MDEIRPDGRWFRDDLGRVRLFRGLNLSGRSKLPPFLPFEPEPRYLDPLSSWGFNLARLVLTWEGVEPARGRIDESYLMRAVALARALGERGFHVLVDLHQDIFSRAYGGSGAPAWALPPDDRATPGWLTGKRWFLAYFLAPGVIRAERDFWTNQRGLQDHVLTVLERVARRFRGVPRVLGYDLWNEPMAPPSWLVSGRFEGDLLARFASRAVEALRAGDPDRMVFTEPAPLLVGQRIRLGEVAGERLGFAPHLYDFASIGLGRYLGRRFSSVGRAARRIAELSERRGWPVVIGEFGALNGVRGAVDMLEDQCQLFDRHLFSWAAWMYDPLGPDWNDEGASVVEVGGAERPWLDPLVRPYPRAVAGVPLTSRFDRAAARYELTFTPTRPGDAPTEVWLPSARRWPNGFQVRLEGGEHRFDETTSVLEIRAAPGASEVKLTVTP
ncbi:MAG: cellulase family glycosylhydrolase [Deltaproteobacteria bacterium]|nr:cellulase family glycosylhydrolase [Deltaproteobacteria bacterium]